MSHTCPAPGCAVDVRHERYACPRHWYSLPVNLRDALWQAYRRHGVLSAEHRAAMKACDEFFEREAAA